MANCVAYHVGASSGPTICGITAQIPDLGTYYYNPDKIVTTYNLSDTFPYITFPRNPAGPDQCTGIPSCGVGLPRLYPASLTVGPYGQAVDIYSFTKIYCDDALITPGHTLTDPCEAAGIKYNGGQLLFSLAAGASTTIQVYENYGILSGAYGVLGVVPAGVSPYCDCLCCNNCILTGDFYNTCYYSKDAKLSVTWSTTSPSNSGTTTLRYNNDLGWISDSYVGTQGIRLYSDGSGWSGFVNGIPVSGVATNCTTGGAASSPANASITWTLLNNKCCTCNGGSILTSTNQPLSSGHTNPCTSLDCFCCIDPNKMPSTLYSSTTVASSTGPDDCTKLTHTADGTTVPFIAILTQQVDGSNNKLNDYLYEVSPYDSNGHLIPKLIWKIHLYCTGNLGGWQIDLWATNLDGTNSCQISAATKLDTGNYTTQSPFTYPYLYNGIPNSSCFCPSTDIIYTSIS